MRTPDGKLSEDIAASLLCLIACLGRAGGRGAYAA